MMLKPEELEIANNSPRELQRMRGALGNSIALPVE